MNRFRKILKILGIATAIGGFLLTGYQLVLLLLGQNTICFNDGCEIVDSLTTVPPWAFNGAGMLYFLLLAISFKAAMKDDGYGEPITRLLLLGGVAVEGVLFAYQYIVIHTFCSYCLIILSIVVFLNILEGFRQIFRGVAVFAAIQIAFFSLQLAAPIEDKQTDLTASSTAALLAQSEEEKGKKEFYLFYSSTCKHCEKVLNALKENPQYNIRFNPIDQTKPIHIEGLSAVNSSEDKFRMNKEFLMNIGISTVPVLYVKDQSSSTLYTSVSKILSVLEEQCYQKEAEYGIQLSPDGSGKVSLVGPKKQLFPLPKQDDENCKMDEECL